MIPYALQTGLRPLVLVRRSISAYSRRSRRRAIALVMSRSEWEDKAVTRDDTSVASSSSTSGICWKRAHHGEIRPTDTSRDKILTDSGSDVLQKSLAESDASDAHSQTFSRQLYLESLTNLIHGLPPDLTDQETLLLRNALTESSKISEFNETTQPRTRNPSLLHRSLASVIVAICLLLRLALPYIKIFLAALYSYDREYHIRERVFALSVTTADSVGRTSVALANTAMTNQVFLRAVTYWVDGIRGGLNEGLDQGLKAMENEDGP